METDNIGQSMYDLLKELFPICRSITGEGVRKTLRKLQNHIPLVIQEVPTGTKVFDWEIPQEWIIRDAYIKNSAGEKIIDFAKNNLHVVGYSAPVRKIVNLDQLQEYLFSLPEKPTAIPYVTSYYERRSGFCLSHNDRQRLSPDQYEICIDSAFVDGSLTYGELIIPGESEKEILLSTNICHPSLANNELSGPVVTTFLTKWLLSEKRRFTYRLVFIPETIGSLVYLHKNISQMKQNVVAGFNITCVGDNRAYSYIPSRKGETLADKVALNILETFQPNFVQYSYLDRGSDERQYCFPGVDLPVVSVIRTKYGRYPEYHTSLDNLSLVSVEGLAGAYEILKQCLWTLENNHKYKICCVGEPRLSNYGLYPTIRTKEMAVEVKDLKNFIAYADGENDLVDISNITKLPVSQLHGYAAKLCSANLLKVYD